ncbi:hypothetical protein PIB30_106429, partial [Stylosanthes scabra]|nr:hypothetical protein [Stylosanthes scabra]
MKKQISEDKERKNEERKLVEQETKFGSKTEEELHAYAWKSTHMRGRARICVQLRTSPRLDSLGHAYAWEANSSRSRVTSRQAQT